MPIKPHNRRRYPPHWKRLRETILNRAGHRCEFCGIPNRAYGWRTATGQFQPVTDPAHLWQRGPDGVRIFRVILTIAHLDHMPEHNDPDNLRALCQRCHLSYDRADNTRKRAASAKPKE